MASPRLSLLPLLLLFFMSLLNLVTADNADIIYTAVGQPTDLFYSANGTRVSGPEAGAKLVFADPLMDTVTKVQIGLEVGVCSFYNSTLAFCEWTDSFPSGSINIIGSFSTVVLTANHTIAGGTGKYAGVAGYLNQVYDAQSFSFLQKAYFV